ncbi:MAG TPA: AI-2E family transporter [Thermococcus paralvinellae]|uniref:AI-2E family transporter n=1 Tax=Thermococcus paralvinellae TaxID=582419 RepID=A0A833E055_9EURY|nr:AI-2E family transporter [Thermococcus paralvinellae]HIP88727.1 AI-2E family transporter [Thermococcus paralvinellae]
MRAETLVWSGVIIGILYIAWNTVAQLLSPIFFAAVFTYAVYPVHKRLSNRISTKKSALVLTALLILIAIVITVELILIFKSVLMSFYEDVIAFISWSQTLALPFGLTNVIQQFYEQFTPKFSEYILSYTFSIPHYLLQLVIFIVMFYYLLVNSEAIKKQIFLLLPKENKELAEKLLKKADLTLQALVRAWLLLNIVKGILMTIGFVIFGVSDFPTAIIAGFLTILFSFVPLFEGWMVWLAGAIYLFKNGNLLTAILLAVYGFIFVSPVPDFTIRPKLVAKGAQLDEVMVLVGMIGGAWSFGVKGLIIGPIVLNLVVALLKEWRRITT